MSAMAVSPAAGWRAAAYAVPLEVVQGPPGRMSWLDEPIAYTLTPAGLAWPEKPGERCVSCTWVGVLVEGSGMCVCCDSLFFPSRLA